MRTTVTGIGPLLRGWREARRSSQLELSSAAGVSTRHLSCVETGRSRPSPESRVGVAPRRAPGGPVAGPKPDAPRRWVRAGHIWADAGAAAFVRRHAGGNEMVPTVDVVGTVGVNPTARQVLTVAREAGIFVADPPRRWWQRRWGDPEGSG